MEQELRNYEYESERKRLSDDIIAANALLSDVEFLWGNGNYKVVDYRSIRSSMSRIIKSLQYELNVLNRKQKIRLGKQHDDK